MVIGGREIGLNNPREVIGSLGGGGDRPRKYL